MLNSNSFLAVDYSKDYLQMMQVELLQKNFTITNYAYLHLNSQSEKYANTISKQIKKLKFKVNKVKIAISDEDAIFKRVLVSSKFTEQDLLELAKIEVAKCIQGNVDDYCLDYRVISKGNKREMLLVIAKKSMVLNVINYLASFGLEVISIDLKSSCIYRLLENIHKINLKSSGFAWFDVSYDTLITYIFYQQQLIFVSTESVQNQDEDILLKIERNLKYLQMQKTGLAIDTIFLFGESTLISILQPNIISICKTKVLIPEVLNNFIIPELHLYKNIQASIHKISILLGLVL